jgi:hypothetical protein
MVKPSAGYRPLAYSSPEAVQTTGTTAHVIDLAGDPLEIITNVHSIGADFLDCAD